MTHNKGFIGIGFAIVTALLLGMALWDARQPESVVEGLSFGAPYFRQEQGLVPVTDSTFYLGTTTPSTKAWLGVITDELCLAGDCKTVWPTGGGGSGNVATSTQETTTYVPFWTSTNATPATLSGGESTFVYDATLNQLTVGAGVFTNSTSTYATSTNFASSLATTSTLFLGTGVCNTLDVNATGQVVCGSDETGGAPSWGSITGTLSNQTDLQSALNNKIGTSTLLTIPNLLYVTGDNTVSSVATGTVSGSGGVTVTANRYAVGGALAITCTAADTNNTGCLSDTDWDTFNNKQGTISATWPITLTGATLGFGGLSTSTQPTISHVPYFSDVNKFSSVATGTLAVPTGLTVTANRYVLGGNATIGLDTGYVIPLQSTLDSKLSSYDAWTHPALGDSATTSNLIFGSASSTVIGTLNITGNATATNATTTRLVATTLASTTSLYLGIGVCSEALETTSTGLVVCGTDATGVGGSSAFEIATTTDLAVPQLAYITKASGRTTLGSVATGTISVPTGLTITANRYAVGGAATIGLDTGYVIPLQTTLDAKADESVTITVAGTANQITSSAGAQDLSANRTWTLSIPNQFVIQQASTTLLSAHWLKVGATASTTIDAEGDISLPAAGTLTIPALTSALLQTDADGLLAEYAGTSCSNQFVRSLSVLGAATCATVGTADVSGLDISDDTNLAATWPVVLTGDTLSWGGLATTSAPTAGNLFYSNGTNGLVPIATSSVTFNAPITTAGTAGYLVGGSGFTLDVDDIGAADLANADFGDFSCNGTTCAFDADTVNSDELDMTAAYTWTGAHIFDNITRSTSTNATSTNSIYAPQITGNILRIGQTASSTINGSGDLLVMGSTTLQNFTGVNATTSQATTTDLYISSRLSFGGVSGTAWTAFCVSITGSSALCDGDDATGAGSSKWTDGGNATYLTSLTDDLMLGNATFANAPFRWDVSATTSYIGDGAGTGQGYLGVGTSTPQWTANLASSTRPQLGLSDALGSDHWTLRSISNSFYVATASPTTWATSTTPALRIDTNGIPTFPSLATGLVRSTAGALSGAGTISNADWSGTDLSVANGGTGLSTFGGANHILYTTAADTLSSEAAFTYTAGSDLLTVVNQTMTGAFINESGSLEIPNAAAPTVDTAGELALDTTSNNLILATSTSHFVVSSASTTLYALSIASTSPDFASGGVIELPPHPLPQTVMSVGCAVDGGTNKVIVISDDGTNDMTSVTCTTTWQWFTMATNQNLTANERVRLEVGASSGTPDYVILRIMGYRRTD